MTKPVFILDLRDQATGKQAAVRLDAEDVARPLGAVVERYLRRVPEDLVAEGRLDPAWADECFRLQDLLFPVDDRGALGREPYRGLVWRHAREGFALDPARPALFERVRRADGPDALVLPLAADRRGVAYDRNWQGFHARRWSRFHPTAERLIAEALMETSPPGPLPSQGRGSGSGRRGVPPAEYEGPHRLLREEMAGDGWQTCTAPSSIIDSNCGPPHESALKSDRSGLPSASVQSRDRFFRLEGPGAGMRSPEQQRRFVEAVARRIWRADFENYSRFLGDENRPPARLKTGDETVENIVAGRGGVCTEKVLALKFITDAHGLESTPVFAGPRTTAPLPVEQLRTMLDELDTYDFTYAKRYLRYWDHIALEYRLSDGSRWLVDPSGGNIPFLCHPSRLYLDGGAERPVVPVTMLATPEPVSYHRAPPALTMDFLFAWETWIDDVDLMQVFDNKLGLLVSDEFYVTPVVWGSATKRDVVLESWRAYARTHALGFGVAAVNGSSPATTAEHATAALFDERQPAQAAWCRAALPRLACRYREYVCKRYGVDKPFGIDLLVLDRGQLRGGGCITRTGESGGRGGAATTTALARSSRLRRPRQAGSPSP